MNLSENRAQICENDLKSKQNEVLVMENNLANEISKVNKLEKQIEYFKSTNTNLLDRLSDLSVVSKTGAESIKKSLEALNEQNKYIKDLTSSMQKKDSLNLVLVMNLKRSSKERMHHRGVGWRLLGIAPGDLAAITVRSTRAWHRMAHVRRTASSS